MWDLYILWKGGVETSLFYREKFCNNGFPTWCNSFILFCIYLCSAQSGSQQEFWMCPLRILFIANYTVKCIFFILWKDGSKIYCKNCQCFYVDARYEGMMGVMLKLSHSCYAMVRTDVTHRFGKGFWGSPALWDHGEWPDRVLRGLSVEVFQYLNL